MSEIQLPDVLPSILIAANTTADRIFGFACRLWVAESSVRLRSSSTRTWHTYPLRHVVLRTPLLAPGAPRSRWIDFLVNLQTLQPRLPCTEYPIV